MTQSTATGAIAFPIGDAELAGDILSVTGASSNTALVPTAKTVLGGTGGKSIIAKDANSPSSHPASGPTRAKANSRRGERQIREV